MKKTPLLFFALITLLIGCKSGQHGDLEDGIFANIQTNKGDIIIRLEHEKTPVTVANFVSLAEGESPFVADSLKGKKFYDGLIFHRVMKDFMIQGGDPLGTGRGNPGYRFKDEFNDSLKHSKAGILSMANSGPKTNGSQFFITHKETPWLNGKHTVFGEVVEGMEVVDAIANTETSQSPPNRPVADVVMNTVEIIRKGKVARKFDAVEVMSDYFAAEEAAEEAKKKMLSDFVAEVEKQMEVAQELPSGLKIYSLKKGSGEKPKVGDNVMGNYAGWLSDGTLFDSNIKEVAEKFGSYNANRSYAPIPFGYSPEAAIIPGFREGLLTMNVGDKVRLFIPPHLGYGGSDYGPIPGNSNLIFDLEIVEIAK